jgi:hypothetical protein
MQPAVLFDQPQKFGLDFTQLTRHVTLTLRLATPGGHNPEFLLQFQFFGHTGSAGCGLLLLAHARQRVPAPASRAPSMVARPRSAWL